MLTPQQINKFTTGFLPHHLGIVITHVSAEELRCEMVVNKSLLAPNGYLHAGSIVTIADSACGLGCQSMLPPGAAGFTTIELKSNFLGTTLEGTVDCIAKPVHLGRTTQVWDAVVTHRESGKTLALFRCTQMVLYPKKEAA
jgi:1,4-dihydroxy-2-naphthoyl-CoA hydrolase